MELEELNIYRLAMDLGEKAWKATENWKNFERDTIGKQLVRAADSVAANISEGYGRFHFRESVNFMYYARGSLFEVKTWFTKAFNRNLIDENQNNILLQDIKDLGVKLNNYISTIKRQNQKQSSN